MYRVENELEDNLSGAHGTRARIRMRMWNEDALTEVRTDSMAQFMNPCRDFDRSVEVVPLTLILQSLAVTQFHLGGTVTRVSHKC